MQLSIKIDDKWLRAAAHDFSLAPKDIKKIQKQAAWDTAKQTVTDISTRVRKKVAIKKKDLDPHLKRQRAANKQLGAVVKLKESYRLSLKDFGARQLKRGGVTYKISKDASVVTLKGGKRKGFSHVQKSGVRGKIPDAFMIDKLGGHVFRRTGKHNIVRRAWRKLMKKTALAAPRLPISKLHAVSAWGVVVKNEMEPAIKETATVNLQKNLERRVRLDMLRKIGVVKH